MELYPMLAPLKKQGFVLFGGTAIALQLGHRISVDFDFFRADSLDDQDKKFLLEIPGIQIKTILQNSFNTLSFMTNDDVKISFFGGLDFVKSVAIVTTDDAILNMANLTSLLGTKLKVINDRAEYKDYKDIAEILKSKNSTLKKGMDAFKSYYGSSVPEFQILKGLQFFDDGDLYKLSDTDKKILIQATSKYEKENNKSQSNEIQSKGV